MDMAREGLPVAGKQIWEVFEGGERDQKVKLSYLEGFSRREKV